MSQDIFSTINPATTSGNQLATLLNAFKEALMSSLSGNARPTELDAGGIWLDVLANPIWYLKMYDGTTDLTLLTINTATGIAGATGASGSFSISKSSVDTASPLLDFIKSRTANNGQVLTGDYIGTVNFKGNAIDSTVPVTVRIRAIATEDYTGSNQGTDLIFEAITAGGVVLSEKMRLKDGKLGVGTSAPTHTIHAVGVIKAERTSNDTTGAEVIIKKTRTGGVLSADVIGVLNLKSTDDAASEVDAAKIEAIATQNHTASAHGSALSLSVKKTGATTFTEMLRLGDIPNWPKGLSYTCVVDSTTTGTAQSITPTTVAHILTNASLVSLNNIAPTNTKLLILMNMTGATVTILKNTGGTAANRVRTGTVLDLGIANESAIFLVYDDNASRWQVVGGSGSGGGALSVTAVQTVTAAGTITTDASSRQLRYVKGDTGGVAASTTPFGTGGWTDGTEVIIYGESDTDFLDITYNDANYGVVGNFDIYSITNNKGMRLIWKNSALRWLASPA